MHVPIEGNSVGKENMTAVIIEDNDMPVIPF